MKKYGLVLFLLLISATVMLGQTNQRFRYLDVNRGLAHTDATALSEDENGFIWIGTNSGVQRFDGHQTRLFFNNLSPLKQVYNNRILFLHADGEFLWVGNEGGLSLLHLKTEKYIPLKFKGIDFNQAQRPVSKILTLNGKLFFLSNASIFTGDFDAENHILTVDELSHKATLPARLKNASITSIEKIGPNVLWLGTQNGLAALKVNQDKIFSLEDLNSREMHLATIPHWVNHIRYHDGKLWVLSEGYLYVFSLADNGSRLRNILKSIDLSKAFKEVKRPNETISWNDFLMDHNHNFWCATSLGLLLINEPLSQDPEIKHFKHSDYDVFSISSNNISCLLIDHSNCLWAATWAGGVSYLDLEQKQFGLVIKNPGRPEYSLSDPFVRAISEDPLGRIWVGGQNEGIDFFYPVTGRCHPFRIGQINNDSLSSRKIRSLKYHDGKMFIGTTKGLTIIDIYRQKIYRYEKEFEENNPIYSIDTDGFGNIWIGTWKGGVFQVRFKNEKLELIRRLRSDSEQPFQLTSNQINYILGDIAKNEVLVATQKGLNRILLDENGLVNNVIYYLGNESDSSLSSEYVWPIQKESDSVYWVGTLGGGLNRLVLHDGWDNSRRGNYSATSFSVIDGAPANDIETLLRDENGNLWIGSKGLSVFNPQTQEFWNFDVNDGLQSNGFKIGSAFKSNDGMLFFGGIKGRNYLRPRNIVLNKIRPRVALTGLRIRNAEIFPGQEINQRVVLNNSLPYTKELKLTYKENNFSLSFAALHYANPEKCTYRYKLIGYDSDWHKIAGNYPIANFSNLDYGNYIFMVDATNGDGVWSGSPIELKIHISPPWWLSGWAYFTYFVLLLAITGGVFYYTHRWIKLRNELRLVAAEEQKKEELHQMKLQFFMNISHEFKTPLTLILTPLEKLKQMKIDNEEHKRMLQHISTNANRLLKLINELMDFRKAEVGRLELHATKADIVEFAQEIYQQFVPLCQNNNIVSDFHAEAVPAIWFDHEKMSTILYNLLANAINYTEDEGKVTVNIFQSKRKNIRLQFNAFTQEGQSEAETEYLYVQVSDTGVGISSKSISQIFDRFFHMGSSKNKHLGSGIGLALLKNLVLLHHGHVIVSSERFKGTQFLVGLPIGDAHIEAHEPNENTADMAQLSINAGMLLEANAADVENAPLESFKELPVLLLVEDNNELREVLREHFIHHFKVIEAENGKIALEKIANEMIEFVISDIMMPEMDGLELVRHLRQNIETSHLPIALLTAKSSIEDQIAGIETGADLYFPKPFNLRLMDLKIKQLLNARKKLKEKYAQNVFAESRELARTQKDKEFIDKFIALVDKNIDNNDFSIDHICKEMSIGRTNLYKKIRSLTGQSMGEFIRSLRLKKAAQMLLTEDVSISEVIYRVGINSNSYFTKSFKTHFGMTPTEFIKKNTMHHNKANQNT